MADLTDRELRIECARLAAVFSSGAKDADPARAAADLYNFILESKDGDRPVQLPAE